MTGDHPSPLSLAIVDHDMMVLRTFTRLFTEHGLTVTAYRSAEAFRESLAHGAPDAVLADLRIAPDDGAALLEQLREDGHRIPMIFLSERPDTALTARAVRAGAIDVFNRPCDENALIASIDRAIEIGHSMREVVATSDELRTKWETLTPREQQVCSQVVQGRPNRQIAADLGTREKTIKVHRARVMAKMGARSLPELVRSIDRLGNANAVGGP